MASSLCVFYTPEYAGDHRICYRIQGASPGEDYCCIDDTTVSVPGVPKSFTFIIADAPCGTIPPLDLDACINIIYEGYVQPSCESVDADVNKVYWEVTFAPDPPCVDVKVSCINQVPLITGYLTITDPGERYNTALNPIGVTIVRDPLDPVLPGGGNDATATATAVGTSISSVTIGAPGLYGIPPTFIIDAPTLPGPPPPVTATVIAEIPCGSGDRFYYDCNGATHIVELGLGESINTCMPKAQQFFYEDTSPVTEDTTYYGYEVDGCCDCNACRNFNVTMTSGTPGITTATVRYVTCKDDGDESQVRTVVLTTSAPTSITCMIPNTLYDPLDPTATFTIVDNGECLTCP